MANEKRYEPMCPVCKRTLVRELGLRTETERYQHILMASLAQGVVEWWKENKDKKIAFGEEAQEGEESLFKEKPKWVDLAERIMKIEGENFPRLIDKLPAALGKTMDAVHEKAFGGGRKVDQNLEFRRPTTRGGKIP